jgi:thymidylate synthase
MLRLTAGSANELFAAACAAVLATGDPVAPRGRPTVEVLGAHLCLTQPRRRLVQLPPVRLLNAAFAAAETVWILSGSDAAWIYNYNARLIEFADAGRLMGAYGPRLRAWPTPYGRLDQLDAVRRQLSADPASRRAVIQLFDPARDHADHKDVPCTLGYRFYLRDGRLDMHTTMRSQDLWLGFCYDLFTATVLHELMAGWLGAALGSYHHHVDSLHLYAEHLDAAHLLATPSASTEMTPLSAPWNDFDTVLLDAISGRTADGGVPGGPAESRQAELSEPDSSQVGTGWAEFAAVMRSYRLWGAGDRAEARTAAHACAGVLGGALLAWYDELDARRSQTAAVSR